MKETYRWDEENKTKVGKYLTAQEKFYLERFFKAHKVNKCLELGCGSGRFTIDIAKKGIEIIGVDNDQLPLRILKKKAPNVRTILMDATKKLPFKRGEFDCFLAIQFADYLEKLKPFLLEANRLLKKNGFLVFTLANRTSYKKILHGLLGKDKNSYRFSYQEVKNGLQRNGFKLLEAYGYHWVPFKRNSNSPYLNFAVKIEKTFKLNNLPKISPWVLYIGQKNEK